MISTENQFKNILRTFEAHFHVTVKNFEPRSRGTVLIKKTGCIAYINKKLSCDWLGGLIGRTIVFWTHAFRFESGREPFFSDTLRPVFNFRRFGYCKQSWQLLPIIKLHLSNFCGSNWSIIRQLEPQSELSCLHKKECIFAAASKQS